MHNFIQTVRIDMTFHPCSMAPDGGLLAGSCLVGNFAHARRSTPRRWDPIPKPQLPTHHMFSLDFVSSGQVQPPKGHFKRGEVLEQVGPKILGGFKDSSCGPRQVKQATGPFPRKESAKFGFNKRGGQRLGEFNDMGRAV